MIKMEKGLNVPKWVLINQLKNNPNAPKFTCPKGFIGLKNQDYTKVIFAKISCVNSFDHPLKLSDI